MSIFCSVSTTGINSGDVFFNIRLPSAPSQGEQIFIHDACSDFIFKGTVLTIAHHAYPNHLWSDALDFPVITVSVQEFDEAAVQALRESLSFSDGHNSPLKYCNRRNELSRSFLTSDRPYC